jgi:multidrug efflux pump subunit AcrA (membrane-fusion protein)
VKYFVLFLAFSLGACTKKEATLRATYRPLIEGVYASGVVAPRSEYKVYSLGEGFLTQKLVSQGDEVTVGQPLFRIDAKPQLARAEAAATAYQQAQDNLADRSPVLQELRAAAENARIRLANDSVQHSRYQNLLANQATSQAEYDRVAVAYRAAQNDYRAALDRLKARRNQLVVDVKNARSLYETSAKEQADFTVRSQLSGLVYEVYKEQGELVRKNDALALLGEKNGFFLKLNIDETDIGRIRPGQEVAVKLDMYPTQVFTARVAKVFPMFDKATQSFRVDAEFAGQAPQLFSGLSAEANIVVQQKDKVLVLPKSCLHGPDSVWVLHDGKKEKIRLKIGLQNLEYVEVVSGIGPETEVLQ